MRDVKHHHWAMYDTMPRPIFWRWCHFSLFCLVWFTPLSKDKTTLTKHFLELRTPWRSLMKPSTSLHSIIYYYNMIFLFICFVLWQKTSVKSMCDFFKSFAQLPLWCQIELHEGYLKPLIYIVSNIVHHWRCSKSITHLQNL